MPTFPDLEGLVNDGKIARPANRPNSKSSCVHSFSGTARDSVRVTRPFLCPARLQDPAHAEGAAAKAGPEEADGLPSLSVRECAASASFWLLFVTFGLGTGCGLMFVNNLGAQPACPVNPTSATCCHAHPDVLPLTTILHHSTFPYGSGSNGV